MKKYKATFHFDGGQSQYCIIEAENEQEAFLKIPSEGTHQFTMPNERAHYRVNMSKVDYIALKEFQGAGVSSRNPW